MIIIVFLFLYWLFRSQGLLISKATKMAKTTKQKPARAAETTATYNYYEPSAYDYRAEQRVWKEEEKERKASEKEEARLEKERQKREQAEADKEFLMGQLDMVSDLLQCKYEELEKLDKNIKIDEAMHKYDKANDERKKRERLQNRIMSYEAKLHNLESRLAKCHYIINA